MFDDLERGIATRLQLVPRPGADRGVLAAALTSLLGERVDNLRSLGGGSISETFGFSTPTRELVAKINADTALLAGTARNFATLSALGVPVPEVVAFDDSLRRAPYAIFVTSRLPGRELGFELLTMSRAQMATIAAQITEAQKAVATLPRNTGYGYVAIGEKATRTWADVVHHPSAVPDRDPPPADCADLVPRLHAAIDLVEPYLEAVEPTCFLDDLTTKNVLVDDGELAGVVDFDVVCYGDPLFQVALTAASVEAGFPQRCAHYVEELVRRAKPSEVERGLIRLYKAVFLTQFVTNERSPNTDPTRKRVIAAAHREIDRVEQHFLGSEGRGRVRGRRS